MPCNLSRYIVGVRKGMDHNVASALNAAAQYWHYGLPPTHPIVTAITALAENCAEESVTLRSFYRQLAKMEARAALDPPKKKKVVHSPPSAQSGCLLSGFFAQFL